MSGADPEIEAMSAVASALSGLSDDEARSRVLRWAADRYGIAVAVPVAPVHHVQQSSVGNTANNVSPPNGQRSASGERQPVESRFVDFVDLFDAVDPKSDVDKALTGAYWLQVEQGQQSWQSQKVNNLLKVTGHGVANVTTALTTAQKRSPALVRQMAKSGKAQQARKTYKLTTSGIAHIRAKLGLTGAVPAAIADHGEDEE